MRPNCCGRGPHVAVGKLLLPWARPARCSRHKQEICQTPHHTRKGNGHAAWRGADGCSQAGAQAVTTVQVRLVGPSGAMLYGVQVEYGINYAASRGVGVRLSAEVGDAWSACMECMRAAVSRTGVPLVEAELGNVASVLADADDGKASLVVAHTAQQGRWAAGEHVGDCVVGALNGLWRDAVVALDVHGAAADTRAVVAEPGVVHRGGVVVHGLGSELGDASHLDHR